MGDGKFYHLVKFNNISGEYSFPGVLVLAIEKGADIDEEVVKFFKDYYGEDAFCEGVGDGRHTYFYHYAEIGVTIDVVINITGAHAHRLGKFGAVNTHEV